MKDLEIITNKQATDDKIIVNNPDVKIIQKETSQKHDNAIHTFIVPKTEEITQLREQFFRDIKGYSKTEDFLLKNKQDIAIQDIDGKTLAMLSVFSDQLPCEEYIDISDLRTSFDQIAELKWFCLDSLVQEKMISDVFINLFTHTYSYLLNKKTNIVVIAISERNQRIIDKYNNIGFIKYDTFLHPKLGKMILVYRSIQEAFLNNFLERKTQKDVLAIAKNYVFSSPTRIPESFSKAVIEIKEYLYKIKIKFDKFDALHNNRDVQINFINDQKPKIFKILDFYFDLLWELTQKISDMDYFYMQKYSQNNLLPYLATEPLNKRIYEKPLGYAGDYIMMNYYYDDIYEGDSSYDMLLHRYTLELRLSRSHINRKKYFKQKLKNVDSIENIIRISSIGCGPARELVEFLAEYKNTEKNIVVNCIDADSSALTYLESKIHAMNLSPRYQINYYKLDVLSLLRKTPLFFDTIKNQNFIYSAGLFDYFQDRSAKAVVDVLYSLLAPRGQLIIVNVNSNHTHKAYMEMLGEWHLNLRDETQLIALASGVVDAKVKYIESYEENNNNIFLVIEK